MPNIFLAMAGNIGVGKSDLCVALSRCLHARPETEDLSQNPYFEDFYEDPRRWAFPSQLAFAAEAVARHIRAQDDAAVVMDRTLYEGVHVFAGLLESRGDLDAGQFALLAQMSTWLRALPRQPDLLVYLTAPPEILMERISARDRRGERDIDISYLEVLDSHYRDFIAGWDICPVLTVDTAERDFRLPPEVDRLAGQIPLLLN